MKSKRNDALAAFAFLATVLVVMCHADDVLLFIDASRTSPLVRFLGGTFSDANVYNFFCLSGYFLGRHAGESRWWRAALVKRVSTLLVPYVLWNVVYFVKNALSGNPHPSGLPGLDAVFGILPGSTPECFPMWYVKTLYCFVLASPLFAWPLLKCRTFAARAVLMGAVVAAYAGLRVLGFDGIGKEGAWGMGGFDLLGFVFFCGGLWLSREKIEDVGFATARPLLRWGVAVGALGVWLGTAVCADGHPMLHELNVLVSSVCLFLIACSVRKVPAVLVRNAFFVYGLHMLVLNGLGSRLPDALLDHSVVAYVLLLAAATGLSAVCGEMTRRVLPTLYAPLVGGRV